MLCPLSSIVYTLYCFNTVFLGARTCHMIRSLSLANKIDCNFWRFIQRSHSTYGNALDMPPGLHLQHEHSGQPCPLIHYQCTVGTWSQQDFTECSVLPPMEPPRIMYGLHSQGFQSTDLPSRAGTWMDVMDRRTWLLVLVKYGSTVLKFSRFSWTTCTDGPCASHSCIRSNGRSTTQGPITLSANCRRCFHLLS